jgi:hypothetical protein
MSLEGKTPEEIQALAALADDVLSKPDTAGVFQRLVKKNNPNVSMPIVELEDRAAAAIAAANKRTETLENKLTQTESQQQANLLYESLRDDGVIPNRNAFNDLVKWASENGFMTTEQGLRKASMQRAVESEAAEPSVPMLDQGRFRIAEGDLGKEYMKDPSGTALREAAKAMEEIAKGRAKGSRAH